jgi:omega-6 fatty acid desaturase (delta-12 desaturase)
VRESLRSVNLHLWDTVEGKLMSFKEARRRYGVA